MKRPRPVRKPRSPSSRSRVLSDDEKFAREMEAMARDPDIIRVNAEMLREFDCAVGDGLSGFPWTGGEPEDPAARAPARLPPNGKAGRGKRTPG